MKKDLRRAFAALLIITCMLIASCGQPEEAPKPEPVRNEEQPLPENIPEVNLVKYVPDFEKAEEIIVEYASKAKNGVAAVDDYVPLNDEEWEVMRQWILAGDLSDFVDVSKLGTEGEAVMLECRINGDLCRLSVMSNETEQYVNIRMSGMHEVFVKGPAGTFDIQVLNNLVQAAAENTEDRIFSGMVTDLKTGETYRISKRATVKARNYLDDLILTSKTEIDPDDEEYHMELIVEDSRYLINSKKGYLKRQTGGRAEYGREKHGMGSFVTMMWNLDKPR